MEFKKLNDLSKAICISKECIYKAILKYSNQIGIKMLHQINDDIIIPSDLYINILRVIEILKDSLVDYETIYQNKNTSIPIKKSSYIYYLFDDNILLYIGQTTMLPQRISTHISDGKKFDQVSVIETKRKDLLLTERFYIHRDNPKLNLQVMDDYEYLLQILPLAIS